MNLLAKEVEMEPFRVYLILTRFYSVEQEDVRLTLWYEIYPKRWWNPWSKDKFIIIAEVICNGILMRRWNSLDPYRISTFFEKLAHAPVDAFDADYLMKHFKRRVEDAYYFGIK